jgi:beta-mannosidase
MLETHDLCGPWRLRWADGQRGRLEYANRDTTDAAREFDAVVPGEIHLDLWRAGLIADPYVGANCLAARWVEENLWAYRREFDAPAGARESKSRAWLVFEGLDLFATIFLNGQEVGRHENSFYPCRVDVTGKLREGKNVVTVHLDAGLWGVSDKPSEGYLMTPDQRLHKRHWLRKPQCQFGWDWSTRLINVGIHKPVRLEWTAAPARVDQLVPLVTYQMKERIGVVRARLFVEGLTTEPRAGKLRIDLPELNEGIETEVEIKPGLHPVEATLGVHSVDLWWPAGHGEPRLYELSVSLEVDGRPIGTRPARVGFRHVRFNQEPHASGKGRNFVLEINGKPIFAKGANFVPADMIFARVDRGRYESLVALALEANFNFLRVWGGGLYESDDFYDLCDENGILVWQEFIFACGRYPTTDETFTANVLAEAAHNVRRLASHPSLVAWCGNNENEVGAWHWGYDRTGVILPDYSLYHLLLPRMLRAEDPTRYYQPSSPFSPPDPGEVFGVNDPNRDDTGDQHPWTVGFHNTDFRDYRKMICRFPNEGGCLGPVSLPTTLAALGPEPAQQKVASFTWQVHDNSVDSWGEPSPTDAMIRQWLGRDIRGMSVEEFVYFGGIVQGEALREYVDNFRRRMFDSAAAILWMFNECWPAARSWTVVDYFLRRTPAFWYVKRAMAPVSLALVEDAGHDQIVVHGINETDGSIAGVLRYGVFSLGGGAYPDDYELPVTLHANRSSELAAFPRSDWKAPDATAFAVLMRERQILARNRLFLPLFKDLKWPAVSPGDVKITRTAGAATFQCDRFAWAVCLDLDGEVPLADNFFDLYPKIPHTIAWTRDEDPLIVRVGNLSSDTVR